MVFVLATTEAHKVPATIVDRCHRFDFQRPSLEQIAGVLRRVAAEEEIEIPDPAVGMLARAATGSFRDALGTLEQLVTYGGSEVKLEDVLDILGVADAELVLETADALATHDPKAALLGVQNAVRLGPGLSPSSCATSPRHLRHLFVIQTLGEVPDSFSVTAEHTDRLASQAERFSQGEILRAIDFLAAAIAAVKDGSEPRIQLEMALLKATQPQADLSLQALIYRIEQLERRLERRRAARRAERTSGSPRRPRPRRRRPTGRRGALGRGGGRVAGRTRRLRPWAPSRRSTQLKALWPAVAEAVTRDNGMLGAAIGAARPDRGGCRPPDDRLPHRRRLRQEEG